ncbi:Testis- and ovary-specific PAZ domain-containing protein 1 [Collichthys lucidus]|uniref:Protein TOPAZ1 n=1 Tax=Collichthys lucidus TaxID=240159 RepID=A0A4U5VKL0_COLLU|nr:Testis- and ovary-specific PAZ domain-containing protein 1 [Collichthys lucidus]
MSCQIKLNNKPPKSQTHLKSKHKTRVTHVAESGRGKVKAMSARCDLQPRQVSTGARSMFTGLSNLIRNTHPGLTGLASSEGSLRRSVRDSGRGFSDDCISPLWKTSGKQGQKASSPEENTVTSKKIIHWIDPKVTLCDVAQICDCFSPDCRYVLPDLLKNKVVHCFKQDMRAGFQFRPSCLGQKKNEEGAPAKNGECCPRVHVSEDRRHLNEHTNAQSCHQFKSWPSDGSATCSSSVLLGDRTKKGVCRSGMWDTDGKEDPGSGSRLTGAERHAAKKIKLGESDRDGFLPSTPNLEQICCKNAAKTNSRDKEKTCFWMSKNSRSCSDHEAGGSSTLRSDCVHKKSCGEMCSLSKTDAAHFSSDQDTDELESFTCQRVRPYFRENTFSCARTYVSWPFSNSGQTLCTAASPAKSMDPSENFDSNQNQPSNMLQNAPHENEEKREDDGETSERNGKSLGDVSSYSSDSKSMEFPPFLMEADKSPGSPRSEMPTLSTPRHFGRERGHGPNTDSSISTPSPSALGLSDSDSTTLSFMSSPVTHGGLSSLSATPFSLQPSSFPLRKVKSVDASSSNLMVKAVEKSLFYCEATRMSACSSSSSAPPHSSDSLQSWESVLLLPQCEQESDEERLIGKRLDPYCTSTSVKHDLLIERSSLCLDFETELVLPTMLSPVSSPQRQSWSSPGCSEEEEKQEEINTCKHKTLLGSHLPPIANRNSKNSKDYLEHGVKQLEGVWTNLKPQSPPREPQCSANSDEDVNDSNEDVNDGDEEESQDETDSNDYVEQEQVPLDPKMEASVSSDALTDPCSSPSRDEVDGGWPCWTKEEGSNLPETAGSGRDETKAEAAGDTKRSILDEFTAYEQDILLVDVIQDDPELFENLPQESLLKLGPTRVTEAPKTKTLIPRIDAPSEELKPRLTRVKIDFHCDSPDIKEESHDRPWRPQCGSNLPKTQSVTWNTTETKQTKAMGLPDANNNHINNGVDRNQPIQTVNSLHNHISPLMTIKNGPWIPNPANMAEFRRQKSNYCRQYFSESLSCGFKMCRFQHVPMEGDEKFCIETVTRLTKYPMSLQKAGTVFTSYYQNNPPGVYFSMPVLLTLLWSLLKAGMVSDVFSVLMVSLAHKIVPGHEFLLALFNLVREKGLMGFVPELVQLTFKMASAGLVLSLDFLDCVKNTPEFQQTFNPNSLVSASGNHKVSTSAPFPEYLNLAHSIVEIELCTKQQDWRRMGEVFRSICQSSQHPNQMERISGRIAIALLSESKDKLSLPFAVFAETVCQNDDEESLVKGFLGRIGVSLMLRYHKTHQWAKGRRVVEVLSLSKINYSTLKGLFGNEDGASRCHLVTLATELCLLSGSVEGALNTLRENKWFLSSSLWPCEPADLESRTRVLTRLAEKTSHRDTLDVLCNLPGLKEPNDSVNVSRYCLLFNTHLQVCVDRQTLPVASDTVDFMLSKKLAVDNSLLQILLQKLGKQNLWLRAREVFRHSLSVGYYSGVSAPAGFMGLIVPSQLREVELALAFEMFITVNATAILHFSEPATSCLSITLKRTQSCESEYLSAGSRLLSAACIPQPKLIVHYKAVNSSREQVFTLDISSARCWLRHNHLWANEMWMH